MAGMAESEIAAAREGRADSPKHEAALGFARRLAETRGRVEPSDFVTLKQEGFGEGEVAEIIAHVALNIFTNYFNTATEVEIDFPRIELRKAALGGRTCRPCWCRRSPKKRPSPE